MAELTAEQIVAQQNQEFINDQIAQENASVTYGTDIGSQQNQMLADQDAAFDSPSESRTQGQAELLTKGVTSNVTKVMWAGAQSNDLRVRLEVPPEYLKGLGGGPNAGSQRPLQKTKGIVFPYTPSVSFNNQAVYQTQAPTHSIFAQYFYKNSAVGPISISGKLTAQNEYEASIILGIQHLLRALIKMRWGSDTNAGAPPPVCRLHAFGNAMLQNVPVVVQSWKLDYPDGVDYIEVGQGIKDYGRSFVPTMCTLSLELAVQYSRKEQLDYTVDGFLSGQNTNKGFI